MEDITISVKNLKKKFRIHHEARDTVYEMISSIFNKRKYSEDLIILDNISFEIKKGEMFGIIGRNGAGKTTLLRLLSKIYKPDSGTINVNGTLVPFLGLGSGFQVEMTAADNVILYGKLLGFSKKEIKQKLSKIIEFAELEKFADIKLKNFSAGMYARLAFATAMQVNPDIIIVDEVLSVGDINFRKKSHDAFLSFKERGKSIILVSHDLNIIKENCDRVMFLDKGKIVAIGEPQMVIDTYIKYFLKHSE